MNIQDLQTKVIEFRDDRNQRQSNRLVSAYLKSEVGRIGIST